MAQIEKMFNELANLGICNSGQRLWRASTRDVEALVSFWKRWPEYFMAHGDKALTIVRTYLHNEFDVLAGHDIFVDQKDIATNLFGGTVALVGDTTGKIEVHPYGVVKIYAYNNVDIVVECNDSAIVNIEAYQNARIAVVNRNAKCKGYCYDNSAYIGDVEVERKECARDKVFNGKEMY